MDVALGPLPLTLTYPGRAAAMIRQWMRRMIAMYGAKAQDAAAALIQRVWLRRARNRWLAERVGRVFAMARAGDVDGMTHELRFDPDVLFMRDRYVCVCVYV